MQLLTENLVRFTLAHPTFVTHGYQSSSVITYKLTPPMHIAFVAQGPVRPLRTTTIPMAAPVPASPLTANGSLNNVAVAQAFDALTTNLLAQINADTIKDYHSISKWRTPEDKPGFERDPNATWLKVFGQLAIYMEPELSRPTVLLYISTGAEIKYALTLTNTL